MTRRPSPAKPRRQQGARRGGSKCRHLAVSSRRGRARSAARSSGGPFWQHRTTGAWQLPKGLIEPGESAEAAARRETEEELGITLTGEPAPLATIRQAGGKWVEAFALEQSLNPTHVRSNHFELEWPRGSGRLRSFPEIAEARWFTLDVARAEMLASQRPLVDALERQFG